VSFPTGRHDRCLAAADIGLSHHIPSLTAQELYEGKRISIHEQYPQSLVESQRTRHLDKGRLSCCDAMR
jgi:hypothetical protein